MFSKTEFPQEGFQTLLKMLELQAQSKIPAFMEISDLRILLPLFFYLNANIHMASNKG